MSSARKKGSSARGGSARGGSSNGAPSSRTSGASSSRTPSSSSSSRPSTSGSRSGRSSKSPKSTASHSPSPSGKKDATQPGLLERVQERLIKDVFESCTEKDPGWKIMIVDEPSMKVLSAAVGMYDIMERKVTLVESLDKKRAPFKDMSAIYILSPSPDSIEKLMQDFADKTKVLYGNKIFVYFLGSVPREYLEQLKRTKQLMKRVVVLSEINVDFLVKEQRGYVTDLTNPFADFFVRHSGGPTEVLLAQKLVTVCATMNEYPYIRYRQTSAICSSLANIFKKKMDQFVGANANWWYHGSGKAPRKTAERDRSTMLLLDRSSDCLTPLMHDFSYQAMVRDLLTMDGDKITYKAENADNPSSTEDKDVLLNEKDKLWVELRGKHIAQVIEVLSGRIQEVCSSSTNNAFSGGSGGQMSLSQLASALKELPEYREVMSKLSQHMHISHECMDAFNRNGLMDLSDIEQTLATGKDEEGKSRKINEMISRVEGALIRMRDEKDRLRLILVATISQNGLSSSDRDRLLRAAQLSRDHMLVLESLTKLGVQIINNSGGSTQNAGPRGFFSTSGKGTLASSGSFDEESEYASSRYVPPIKAILKELLEGSLSTDEYPSVIPMPMSTSLATGAGSARRRAKGAEGSARKKAGATDKWNRSGNSNTSSHKGSNFVGGRNLVFMVGGLAYSELKACRDLMEKESREILVGSTKFVSPSEFIDDLGTLSY